MKTGAENGAKPEPKARMATTGRKAYWIFCWSGEFEARGQDFWHHSGLHWEAFAATNSNSGAPATRKGGLGRGLETGPEKGRVLKAFSEGVMWLKYSK